MKKLLALLLVFVMMFSFVACGGGNNDDEAVDGDQIQNEQQEDQDQEDADRDADTDEDADADKDDAQQPSTDDKDETVPPTTGGNDTQQPSGGKDTQTPSGGNNAGTVAQTPAQILLKDFKDRLAANSAATPQELADGVLGNSIIQFAPATQEVVPGPLMGFGAEEITGFKTGVQFGPMIGTIPFMGYIFVVEDGGDVAAFEKQLEDNANLSWNICTSAEEMVCESVGNTVFFLMAPASFEEEPIDDAGSMAL